jgi:hypothetical protein
MKANEIGKRLGIGVRVAGRIAQQRAQEQAARARMQAEATAHAQPTPSEYAPPSKYSQRSVPTPAEVKAQAGQFSRAAGRGVLGFLRPFGRVGGILWLEVTGFFFGMFALYFAIDIWRSRLGYASGPMHQRFLIAVGLTLVFSYLSASAFWRAGRR